MQSLTASYSQLYTEAIQKFESSMHIGNDKATLLGKVPNVHGVYLISPTTEGAAPLYIGSSGKMSRGLVKSGSTMRQRLNGALTPYKFGGDEFLYSPTSAAVPPSGYTNRLKVKNLKVTCLHAPTGISPAALEALLLQACINEFGDLPVANQKL